MLLADTFASFEKTTWDFLTVGNCASVFLKISSYIYGQHYRQTVQEGSAVFLSFDSDLHLQHCSTSFFGLVFFLSYNSKLQ